jgi:anthranilate synthase component I
MNKEIYTNHIELFADLDTPVSIYSKLRKQSPDAFLFESVIGGEQIGRYSIIGYSALEKIIIDFDSSKDPYKLLETKILDHNSQDSKLPFFHKGYVGFFSFESIKHIEPSIKTKKSNHPDAYLILVGLLIVFDHVKQKLFLIDNSYSNNLNESKIRLENLKQIISNEAKIERLNESIISSRTIELDSNTGKDRFLEIVKQGKKHIQDGDCFQIVLSHKLSKKIKIDPLHAYRKLRTINPSPYLFLFNFNDSSLVGSSPEMLVKTNKLANNRFQAEIRPIAGTYKRGKNEIEDIEQAKKLMSDPKERAEHVMLIDLARNDLGRVCDNASVKVAETMKIEKYSHVLHIVSSVIGTLKQAYNLSSGVQALRACFPAGTLSGAPKVNAIKIIEELETEARGPYGGTIGYFGLDGSIDTAIMIRTILIESEEVTVQAGAGIVADSNPESEWQETYNKANALLETLSN